MNSNWIKNLLLVIITTFITLAIAEVFLRYTMENALYPKSSARKLYYSKHPFVIEDNAAVHYTPNSLIRSIAVYYNEVEYDTKHHSNNFGFLSDVDYYKDTNKKGILFLGDSFTAGVGSTSPWIPLLDKKYPNINLYSLGATGTGIENFYRTYEAFESKLNYDTIVIMAISDDMTRPLWKPIEKDGLIYFSYNHKNKPIMHTIPANINNKKVLYPEQLYIIKGIKLLKQKLIHKKKHKLDFNMQRTPYETSYKALEKIKKLATSKNKRVLFIHLLEKNEMLKGRYRYKLKDKIEKMGIEYYSIFGKYRFNGSMYHIHDGHPNNKGYQQISEIVSDILKLNNITK